MSATFRKLPPYAKGFLQHDPELPIAFVYFGPLAWTARDNINNRSVILPPDEPSENYEWRFLRGHIVIARCLGPVEPPYYERLALELLLAGADPVHVFFPPEPVAFEGKDGAKVYMDDLMRPHKYYVRKRTT